MLLVNGRQWFGLQLACGATVTSMSDTATAAVTAGELLQADVGSSVMCFLPTEQGMRAQDENFLQVLPAIRNITQPC